MPSRELRVDTEGVRAAGVTAAAAAACAAPAASAVPPCAADATSVHVATRAAGRIGALDLTTATANLTTAAAAARLHGDADAYDVQEASGATSLADFTAAVSGVDEASTVSAPQLPSAPQLAGVPAGIVPTGGHEIAAVIHSGPGPQRVLAVAALLEGTANDLDEAATSVSAAGALAADSWSSDAADAAEQHLVGLENAYTEQASQARDLARHLRTHADDFSRAKAQIPPPQRFADLEARLQAAYAANAHPTSMGRYTQTIADLQYTLAAANNDAINGYERYQQAAQIQAGTMDPHVQPDSGGSNPQAAPEGAGGTQESANAGQGPQTRSPIDPLTAAAADPVGAGGLGEVTGSLMGTVLPAVLGGVSGAAGGLLGALSGAGQQVQQAGSQLVGGLAQGANAAVHPAPAGSSPDGPGGGGQPEMSTPDVGGGGPEPGDMEPAGGAGAAGPLSAPASAPAIAAAAPATYSPSPPLTATAGGGAPMGGAMMPPIMPMGAHPGGGAGENDRRLYPERRVRIETPPNSEPVKGRREARRTRGEKSSEGEAGR